MAAVGTPSGGTPTLRSGWLRSWREAPAAVWWAAATVSIAFGCAQAAGWRIVQDQTLGLGSWGGRLLFLGEIVLASAVFLAVLLPGFSWAQKAPGWASPRASRMWDLSFPRRFAAVFAVLVVCWLGYWLVLWPGTVTPDSFSQLRQALGVTPYSDHHPVENTLAIEAILRPALALTGTIESAISVVTLAQLLVLAGIYAASIASMRAFDPPRWLMTGTLLFFALNPLFGWFSVTLWKDVWLTAFVLALATAVSLVIHRSRLGTRVGWQVWLAFALAALGVMASKKTGIYLVIPLLIVCVWAMGRSGIRRGWNRWWPDRIRWLGIGAGVVVLYVVGHAALISLVAAPASDKREMFSLPSQQIARVVRDNPESLTDAQRAAIARFYPDADIGKAYTFDRADAVKNRFDSAAFDADARGYLSLWAELGLAHPLSYVDTLLASTTGYWYPHAPYRIPPSGYRLVSHDDWVMMLNTPAHRSGLTVDEIDPAATSSRDDPEAHRALLAKEINLRLPQIPGVGLAVTIGAWTWAAVILTAASVLRRRAEALPAAVLCVLVWGTAMISPVYAEARYASPVLALLPLFLVVAGARVTHRSEPTPAEE